MMRAQDLIASIERLQAEALERWIALGWIAPESSDEGPSFGDADVARAHLICDLVYDFEIGEEGVPVILSLLDQLHDNRRLLRALMAAVDAQPEPVKQEIATRLGMVLDPRCRL